MIEIRETVGTGGDIATRLNALLDQNAAALGHPFNRDNVSLTAWNGETFLGGAQYQLNYGWCFLMLLAVTPEGRGQGTGSRLIERLQVRARAEGATGVWLDTYGFEAAPFYRRHGFEEFGRVPGPDSALDRIFMRKSLEETP